MTQYVAIIAIGLFLASQLMGTEAFMEELSPDNGNELFTAVFLVVGLTGFPLVLITLRRRICYRFEKARDDHQKRRMKYGIKLPGETFAGQYRTPDDNPTERGVI